MVMGMNTLALRIDNQMGGHIEESSKLETDSYYCEEVNHLHTSWTREEMFQVRIKLLNKLRCNLFNILIRT